MKSHPTNTSKFWKVAWIEKNADSFKPATLEVEIFSRESDALKYADAIWQNLGIVATITWPSEASK